MCELVSKCIKRVLKVQMTIANSKIQDNCYLSEEIRRRIESERSAGILVSVVLSLYYFASLKYFAITVTNIPPF